MRSEILKFELTLTKEQYDTNKRTLGSFASLSAYPLEGDHVVIIYRVNLDYIGNVATRLRQILSLIEQGIVIKSDIKEMRHGQCLLKDVLTQLEKLNENC